MRTVFAVIVMGLASLTAQQTASQTASQPAKTAAPPLRFDLSGEWQGWFTVNPANAADMKREQVMIQQIGESIVGTKITGDDYVPAGKTTIHGTYNANPFNAEQVCAQKGFVNAHWYPTTITIADANHFTIHNSCGAEAAWERVGKASLALDSAVLFDFDKYDLKPGAADVLAKIVEQLRTLHPSSHLLVTGFTDDIGTAAHNLQLSRNRARSVAGWLGQHGIAGGLIKTSGMGKSHPRYPNVNEEARSHNRRVEITILD